MGKNSNSAQRRVAELVEKRGYRRGYTAGGFMSRQVLKFAEELAELSFHFPNQDDMLSLIRMAGDMARQDFDAGRWSEVVNVDGTWADLKKEATDLAVIVLGLGAMIEEVSGDPFDIIQAAIDKAAADAGRGVRGVSR